MVLLVPSIQFICLALLSTTAAAATPKAWLQQLWVSSDSATSQSVAGRTSAEVQAKPAPSLHTYKLRLCNAYAWSAPLEMRRLQEPKLVEYPLPYKECHDYMLPLAEGDQLQFRAGDLNIGTFSVRGLPKTSTMLLLVPHRRNSNTMAVVFDSHVFGKTGGCQVALVDAYVGPQVSGLYLKEKDTQEELRFNSVITLMPGDYAVNLASNVTGKAGSLELKAHHEEKYVVIRVGSSNVTGESWPEELLLFPEVSRSVAMRAGSSMLTAIALCALLGFSL